MSFLNDFTILMGIFDSSYIKWYKKLWYLPYIAFEFLTQYAKYKFNNK